MEKKQYKFVVKSKTIREFIGGRIIQIESDQAIHHPGMRVQNGGYHDPQPSNEKMEMFFKKDCGIEIGEEIRIEEEDSSLKSRLPLLNISVYIAKEYDDVAIRMVRKSISVESADKQ